VSLRTTITTPVDESDPLYLVIVGDEVMATEALPPVGSVTIGRAPECGVRIDDASISRNHALLQLGAQLHIVDTGSANGTWVREQRIAPRTPVEVRLNEAMRLGSVTVLVQRRSARVKTRTVHAHAYLESRLAEECARAARRDLRFTVVHVAADRDAGLPEVVTACLDDEHVAAAYGPGELQILLVDCDADAGCRFVDRLEAALAGRRIAARVGAASYPRDGRDPDALVARARARAIDDYQVEPAPQQGDVVVADERMTALHQLVARVAAADISVLLHGETGVGKEVIAELVHRGSARAARPFLKLNCAALSEALLESELFGHEKGAFTGAVAAKPGLLEVAEGGTVFLDEIGELQLATQAKLLRVLDECKLLRVGGLAPRPIDVRVISATNRDLDAEVARGGFRRDLLYRLNAMSIIIPPLRERPAEILPLARRFAHTFAARLGRPAPRLTERAIAALRAYAWPGNVRELRNVIERALVVSATDVIDLVDLPEDRMQAPAQVTFAARLADHVAEEREAVAEERQRILEALEACGGNQTNAAKLLGIARRTLINKLDKLALPRPRKR
jgi:two-component system response regulator AtoC